MGMSVEVGDTATRGASLGVGNGESVGRGIAVGRVVVLTATGTSSAPESAQPVRTRATTAAIATRLFMARFCLKSRRSNAPRGGGSRDIARTLNFRLQPRELLRVRGDERFQPPTVRESQRGQVRSPALTISCPQQLLVPSLICLRLTVAPCPNTSFARVRTASRLKCRRFRVRGPSTSPLPR